MHKKNSVVGQKMAGNVEFVSDKGEQTLMIEVLPEIEYLFHQELREDDTKDNALALMD